jgi:hypothetical protein
MSRKYRFVPYNDYKQDNHEHPKFYESEEVSFRPITNVFDYVLGIDVIYNLSRTYGIREPKDIQNEQDSIYMYSNITVGWI